MIHPSEPEETAWPGRQPSSAAQRRQILVFTEGAKTEPGYLLDVYRRNRERVIVTVSSFHGAPLSLVRAAVRQRRAHELDQRRGRGAAYDEYWCMFDVDEHPGIPEALGLARSHEIRIAVSNPCIELWFLLHFIDQTALELLAACHEAARIRAKNLEKKHEGDGSPGQSNPSSSAWRIVDAIRNPREQGPAF